MGIRRSAIIIAVMLAFAALSTPRDIAWAVGITSSSAFGESVNLTVLPALGGPVSITSGPLPSVAGSAPPHYNVSNSALSVTVSPVLTTGLLQVNASSTFPAALWNVFASATVNNANLTLLPLLTIAAQSIASTANIDSTLTATGTTTIVGAAVGGTLSPPAIAVNPAPNTILLNAGGIEVILNEQIIGGNGITMRSIAVNGIHVILTNAALALGLVSGDIILSHAEALALVPAPSSLLLFGSGLAAIVLWRLYRSRRPNVSGHLTVA